MAPDLANTTAASVTSDASVHSCGAAEHTVKLKLYHNGELVQVAGSDAYKYWGGECHHVGVPRSLDYADFMHRITETVRSAVSVRYLAPGYELAPENLIVVGDDEGLQEMFDEYFSALKRPNTPQYVFRIELYLQKADAKEITAEELTAEAIRQQHEHFTSEEIIELDAEIELARKQRSMHPRQASRGSDSSSFSHPSTAMAYADPEGACAHQHHTIMQASSSYDDHMHGLAASHPPVHIEAPTWQQLMAFPSATNSSNITSHRPARSNSWHMPDHYAAAQPERKLQYEEEPMQLDWHKHQQQLGCSPHQQQYVHRQQLQCRGAHQHHQPHTQHKQPYQEPAAATAHQWHAEGEWQQRGKAQQQQPATATPAGSPKGLHHWSKPPALQLQVHAGLHEAAIPAPAVKLVSPAVEGLPSRLGPELGDGPAGERTQEYRRGVDSAYNHGSMMSVEDLAEADLRLSDLPDPNVATAGASPEPDMFLTQEPEPDPGDLCVPDAVAQQPEPELDELPLTPRIKEPLRVVKDDIKILGKLGAGAFGEVSLAKASVLAFGNVAVKWLKAERITAHSKKFIKEAQLMDGLVHPHVLAFYGVVVPYPDSADVVGIITAYCSGGSLTQFLRSASAQGRLLPLKLRCELARQAVAGMAYLHARKIVHFDLKPDNLLIDGDVTSGTNMVVKVADFGLSKYKERDYVSGCRDLRGTLPYIAPEVVSDPQHVTEKADVWSMGVVMWEMLMLQVPYLEKKPQDIMMGLMLGTLALEVPEWCEPEWRWLVEVCLQVDPARRPSFAELLRHLEQLVGGL